MSDEVARLLAGAGCTKINFGIESGNDQIRTRVLNRPISRDKIERAFGTCKAAGMTTQSYNMIGIPFETPEAVLDTIRLNARVKPEILYKTAFYPYPKTRLHELCRESGLLTEREYDTFFEGTVLSQSSITEGQVNFANQFFYLLVKLYQLLDLLPRPLCRVGDRVIVSFFSSSLVPHGAIAAASMKVMNIARQGLERHLPGLYRYLRLRKESQVQIYED